MINWIMYAEIQNLKRKGLKKAQVTRKLSLHRQTVTKYWDMEPAEFEEAKARKRERKPDI